MRAIVQNRYGEPGSVLALQDIDRPEPKVGELLVRVAAASLHRGDCFVVRGRPFLVRMMTGLFRPKPGIPGFDLAGRVEALGANVTNLAVGDEVFGSCEGSYGACAEYVTAHESKLVRKPAGISSEEAAAVPTSALAALHGLRDAGHLQAAQKVLVNGASGGVGTFAVQIGAVLGAHVTGVCSTQNLERVREIGADEVIDYTVDDFTLGRPRFDLILDNVENRTLAECRRVLAPNGTLVLNSGSGASGLRLLVRLVTPILLAPFVRHRLVRYVSAPRKEDLRFLARLLEEGKLCPVIDRTYSLDETAEALDYLSSGHARGKIVVRVG